MSIKALAWALEQPLSAIPKMILIVLADHHNGETGQCNPSVKRICEQAGVVQRTVEIHIANFERLALVRVEKRYRDDGSRTSNQYHLLLGGGASSPGGEPKPPGGEPTSLLEPGKEPGTEPRKDSFEAQESFKSTLAQNSQNQESSEVWPDWYGTLYAIPGFRISLDRAAAWLADKSISADHAETTAYALKSRWPGPKSNPYKDPWATFQSWVKRAAPIPIGADRAGASRVPVFNDPSSYPDKF